MIQGRGTRVRIVHIITALEEGGAETMLCNLLRTLDRDRYELEVISLADLGPVTPRVRALGVPVRALGMRPGIPDPVRVVRLARWLRASHPDIVQTWMHHADLVGGLAALGAGHPPVIWGIRQSNFDPSASKRASIVVARTCAALSRWLPARIVSCSQVGADLHVAMGYDPKAMVVIPNGFDLGQFRPDRDARSSLRLELGLADSAVLVGLMGRWDPQKDHHGFLVAARLLLDQQHDVHFVLFGDRIVPGNAVLAGWIDELELNGRVHLLGRRSDASRVTGALDVSVSSSAYGEGFSNAIGEAMACGVPCVVTAVGDSPLIVGDTGAVVPPRQPAALADAVGRLLALTPHERLSIGMESRRRIEDCYTLEAAVARFEQVYADILRRGASAPPG